MDLQVNENSLETFFFLWSTTYFLRHGQWFEKILIFNRIAREHTRTFRIVFSKWVVIWIGAKNIHSTATLDNTLKRSVQCFWDGHGQWFGSERKIHWVRAKATAKFSIRSRAFFSLYPHHGPWVTNVTLFTCADNKTNKPWAGRVHGGGRLRPRSANTGVNSVYSDSTITLGNTRERSVSCSILHGEGEGEELWGVGPYSITLLGVRVLCGDAFMQEQERTRRGEREDTAGADDALHNSLPRVRSRNKALVPRVCFD